MRFVDASNNQSSINVSALKKAGAGALYHKVSEGSSFVDKYWHARRVAARAAGMPVGGYHFGHPKNNPVKEADFFLAHYGPPPRRGELRPCLDIEVTDGRPAAHVHDWVRAFCVRVHAKLGVWPTIYASESYVKAWGLEALPGPKWVAKYAASEPGVKWDAWQYTDGRWFKSRSIGGLDTSVTHHLALLQYRPGIVKIQRARLKKLLHNWVVFHHRHGWSWARIKRDWHFKKFKKIGGK